MSEDHLLALMAAILYSGERVAKVKKPEWSGKMKDTSVIPYGDYCYTIEKPTAVEEALFKIIPGYRGLSEITPCPFWSAEPSGRAHCSFLGIDSEPYPDDPFIKGGGLIWDQVKECGVNPWRPDGPKE